MTVSSAQSPTIRIMIADDSAVIRGLLARTLEGQPDFQVVASVSNGEMAVATLARQPVDVIVLDIEMPVMDGLTALPKLLAADKNVKIIMVSTLTVKNAEISMKALQLGATDYLGKPTSVQDMQGADQFRRDLVEKVRVLGLAAIKAGAGAGRVARVPIAPRPQIATTIVNVTGANGKIPRAPFAAEGGFKLRAEPIQVPDIIAIGSSTGGPQALFDVIPHLQGLAQPVVLTQHMPPTFTTILAQHITKNCGVDCKEAAEGDIVRGGKFYLAPGDFHMLLSGRPDAPVINLQKGPHENFCRPAVDPMLRSLIPIYGKKILVVILTGMGQDGWLGADSVVKAGGAVVAQDEKTSVVWGMPGAVANAGLCTSVLPVKEIGPYIRQIAARKSAA
jgi:two-component system, chemotaxis family, protein-glutamate methylesterase/glutaminase